MRLKGALVRNALAGGSYQIANALYRLVQVPIFLAALGVEEYGRWLVMTSLPSLLTLANLGFGSVAANDMSMAIAADKQESAREVFSTSLALILLIGIVGVILVLIGTPFVPWERIVGVAASRHMELLRAAVLLAISVFASFPCEVYGGRLRSGRQAHVAIALASVRPWLELLAIVVVLQFSARFDYLSCAILAAAILNLILFQSVSWRAMPSITFSFACVRPRQFRRLFKKGIAFQALALGNAFLNQGNLLVVQSVLGPAAVALFGTARTLVGVVNQAMGMINQITWPEFSHLLGQKDLVRAARLHRIGLLINLSMALCGMVALGTMGQSIYGWWTGRAIALPQHLLLLFLLPVPFTAISACSHAVLAACNQHEGLAIRYMFGTVLSLVGCVILSLHCGIEGAALSVVLVNVFTNYYALKRALELTGDTWRRFADGVMLEVISGVRLARQYIWRDH